MLSGVRSWTGRRRLCRISLLVPLLALAGCVPGEAPRDLAAIDRALRGAGFDPATIVIPYETTAEMRSWALSEVVGGNPEERLDRLLNAIVDPRGLGLQYESGSSRTAPEVFALHKANCLGFTSLFVALAREIGIEAFYLGVDDVERFEREGDLLVISGHISAGFDVGGGKIKILEFTSAPKVEYRKTRRLSDLTAIALYHSNRGAEELRGGQTETALPWLRKAVLIDPQLGDAWVNLGVALRRTGKADEAERAYRRALEMAPDTVSAYHNLASLLRAHGHGDEADELLSLASKIHDQDPFSYLALGDVALAHGRLDEAKRFYRKAMALYREDAEPYAALGQVACRAGDYGEGRRWYRKAVAKAPGGDRVQKLEETLRRHGAL